MRLPMIALSLLVFLAGCGGSVSQEASPRVTVAAAASLRNAFTEIARDFTSATGVDVVLVFGASGTLAKQIEAGAPFDVFASADRRYVEELAAKGLITGETPRFALGRLALVARKSTQLSHQELRDLADPSVKRVAIANPAHAPYGAAAREALAASDVWEAVQPKLVYGEDVQQALQFVESGNADAGLVALSLVDASRLHVVPVDLSIHTPLEQVIAVVGGRQHEDSAIKFVEFVVGQEGRTILAKNGFGTVEE